MGVSIEWKIGIFRSGPEFQSHLTKDKYAFSCMVAIVNNVAYFEGGSKERAALLAFNREEIRELLAPLGVTEFEFTRIDKLGRSRPVHGPLYPRARRSASPSSGTEET